MRVRGLIWVVGLAIVATALVPGTAGAKTLGPRFSASDSDFGTGCSSGNCIFMQRTLPGATLKAPYSGRIKKWRFVSPGPYNYQLIVLRPEGGGEFGLVRASQLEHVVATGKWTFSANLRIRKGDRVGIYLSAAMGNGVIAMRNNSAAEYAVFEPPPVIGGSGSPGAPLANEVLFNATLKR